MNETDREARDYIFIKCGLFESAANGAQQEFHNQKETLQLLFDKAKDAASQYPTFPGIKLDPTSEDLQAMSDFFKKQNWVIGARDAYATAIVMYIDTMFKGLWLYYKEIPGVDTKFTTGVKGIDLRTIFQHAANNVRHYLDWVVPPHELKAPKKAVATASTIATLYGREKPVRENVSVYGVNHAWGVINHVSGGTFDGLVELVQQFLWEMKMRADNVRYGR